MRRTFVRIMEPVSSRLSHTPAIVQQNMKGLSVTGKVIVQPAK